MQPPRKSGSHLSAGASSPKIKPKRARHDNAYKYLFSNRNIFHQLLVSFVGEDFVKGLRPEDLELVPASFVAPGLKDRHADLIYRVSRPGREWFVYILLENQSTPDKTILLRSFLYILMLYDQVWRNSTADLLPNVIPIILYNGEDDWNLPSNLSCLIAKNLPDRYIPSFEYFPLIEKDVPEATLDRLHNLVAAVILLERQKDEAGLARAIAKVIDFIKDEDILNIRDLLEWMGKLFKDGPEPESIQKLRTVREAGSMLSALAERMEIKYKSEGKIEGKIEGKLETARLMHVDGLTIEQIIKYTGLSRAVILSELGLKAD
ncbi:MAG: Rpn family recombination-promoting nuclease/putative transposase [Clostridia bacterium]|jgi:predicted transposase/invertase (TIGR01784 family)